MFQARTDRILESRVAAVDRMQDQPASGGQMSDTEMFSALGITVQKGN